MLSSAEHSRSSARTALARLERLIVRHYGLTLIEQHESDPPRRRSRRGARGRRGGLWHRSATPGRVRAA
jgi:hypothetical protein